jgi:transposase
MAPQEPPTEGQGLERLLRDRYGETRGGRANTRAAADDLGVSIRQVQRWLKAEREGREVTRSAAHERLTAPQQPPAPPSDPTGPRRPGRPSTAPPGPPAAPSAQQREHDAVGEAARGAGQIDNLETELRDRYGNGPRGGINTAAAADDLGVSERRVQDWLKRARDGKPPPQRSDAFDRLRQHVGEDQMRQRGAKIRLAGTIRVSSDIRPRTIEYSFTGDEISDYLARRDEDDLHALQDWLSDVYIGGDMTIETLDSLDFDLS